MATLINLTPHDVVIFQENDTTFDPKTRSYTLRTNIDPEVSAIRIIKSSGIARCTMQEKYAYSVDDTVDVDVYETTYGNIEGLPEPQKDYIYIVSALLLNACPERKDLVCPSRTVRDNTGRVVGCLAFSGRK